jgi:hypothetical protein
LIDAAHGGLKPSPTERLRRVFLHLSYSMALSRLLDTTPPRLLPAAACGGLRSAPDHRTRRALLHLSYSCAPLITHAALVTHDPNRPFAPEFCLRVPDRPGPRSRREILNRNRGAQSGADGMQDYRGARRGSGPPAAVATAANRVASRPASPYRSPEIRNAGVVRVLRSWQRVCRMRCGRSARHRCSIADVKHPSFIIRPVPFGRQFSVSCC